MRAYYHVHRDKLLADRRAADALPERREERNRKARERFQALSPEEREARNEYSKKYRQQHQDRLKAQRQTPEGLAKHRETQRKVRERIARLPPLQRRARWMPSKYGIDVAEFQSLWDSQDGKCGICERTLMLTNRGCHVDHDHKSGQVRGLLCHGCNTSLGHFKDSVDNLLRAIAYLQR